MVIVAGELAAAAAMVMVVVILAGAVLGGDARRVDDPDCRVDDAQVVAVYVGQSMSAGLYLRWIEHRMHEDSHVWTSSSSSRVSVS